MSGHESRYDLAYQEQVKRIHDGAIGDVVAIQSMFLRARTSDCAAHAGLTEMQYQFANWYHFCWLSGDDVTQSLVHNLDRMRLGAARRKPHDCASGWADGRLRSARCTATCSTTTPSSTSLPVDRGSTRCARRARTVIPMWDDVIMGTKGTCYWTDCRIEGETPWRYEGPQNSRTSRSRRS